jgi:hypothetical protein
MAFGLKRFVAWGIVGAAAIVAGWFGMMASTAWNPALRFNPGVVSVERRARQLESAMRVLQVRDSIATALRAHPQTGSLAIIVAAAAGVQERAALERTVRGYWNTVVGPSAKSSTAFVFVNDSARQALRNLSVLLVPGETDGRTCVVVVSSKSIGQAGRRPLGPADDSAQVRRLDRNVGVCALYAKYGAPGPEIRRWLRSESWQQAAVVTSVRRRALHANPDAKLVVDPSPTSRLSTAFARQRTFENWYGDWQFGVSEIACLGGSDEMCAAPMRSPNPITPDRRSAILPAGVIRLAPWALSIEWDHQLVAALEDQLGPERFAAFWTSAKSPEEAILDASGKPVGALIKAHLVSQFSPAESSPWPTAFEWLVQLTLLGGVIGAMIAGNRRRYIDS